MKILPIYEFECESEKCKNIQEAIFRVNSCPKHIKCKKCGNKAKKIISSKGAIFTDGNVIWMDSVVSQMRPDYDKRPIETRTELKSYLKDNGLIWTG